MLAADQAPKNKKTTKSYLTYLDSSAEEQAVLKAINFALEKKDSKAIPKIITLLQDERTIVRLKSCVALGELKSKEAIDVLNKIVLEDDSSDVRYASLLAIIKIGSDKSGRTLQKLKAQEKDPIIKDFLAKMEKKLK